MVVLRRLRAGVIRRVREVHVAQVLLATAGESPCMFDRASIGHGVADAPIGDRGDAVD